MTSRPGPPVPVAGVTLATAPAHADLAPAPPAATTVTTSSPATKQAAVRGDGTTTVSRITARLRSWRWPLLGLGAVLLAGAVLVSLTTEQSTVRFAPDNPSANGAMALAEVLEDHGVEVVYTTSVPEAIGASGPGSSLLVANDYGMPDDVARSLLDTGSAIVLVAPGAELLAAATSQVTHASMASTGTTSAQCTDPDAVAAREITSSGSGFRVTEDGGSTRLCFLQPTASGTTVGHYAIFPLAGDDAQPVRALDDATPLTNGSITEAGNAALGLRMLGQTDRLVWLLPEQPPVGGEAPGFMDTLPPWMGALGVQLLVLALVTAVWRGRRLGPLVTEDLPVVVQASETTRGRGRLYRRARAHGHAGAALRARSADRMAQRLGLPRSAGADAVVDAVARASGRPAQQVGALLYGPPPSDDVELTRLATDLDQLESEVHRA